MCKICNGHLVGQDSEASHHVVPWRGGLMDILHVQESFDAISARIRRSRERMALSVGQFGCGG